MIDTYLKSIGMKRIKGDGLDPILPFIMMDAMYQIYTKEIKPLPCRHELKHVKKTWIENYNVFNRSFFRAFNVEQQGEVIDMMDSFEQYIHNDMLIAKLAIMNEMKDLSTDDANVCASCVLCNILAQAAHIVWSKIFLNSRLKERTNIQIQGIEKCSTRFMNLYHSQISDRHVDPNKSKRIVDSVDILCKKMIKWLKENKNGDDSCCDPMLQFGVVR